MDPTPKSVALQMPLTHAISERGFRALLEGAAHLLLTSHPARSASWTLTAEHCLGFQSSLYFYAGRVRPAAGDAVFLLAAHAEVGHTGAATPFDTGALVHHTSTTLERPNLCPELALTVQSASIPLSEWRAALAAFLSEHFVQPSDYWNKPPTRPLPFPATACPWEAWTFEVRFFEAHDVEDRQNCIISGRLYNALLTETVHTPTFIGLSPHADFLIDSRTRVCHDPSLVDYAEQLIQEISLK